MFLKTTFKNSFRLRLEAGEYMEKEKNDKENHFLMFGSMMENIKENVQNFTYF